MIAAVSTSLEDWSARESVFIMPDSNMYLLHCLQVGERLGKYEVEKRQAVETEDYDKAKLKKVQMDEYRLQMYKDLGIPDLLQVILLLQPVV